MLESWLSSLNDARIAALSFRMTARSSAIVFADRTFRINCLTICLAPVELVIYTARTMWGGRGKGAGKHSRDVIAVVRDPPQGIGLRAKGQEKKPVVQIEYQGNAKKSACAIRSRGG